MSNQTGEGMQQDRRIWHPFDPSYSHADRCVVCGHRRAAHLPAKAAR